MSVLKTAYLSIINSDQFFLPLVLPLESLASIVEVIFMYDHHAILPRRPIREPSPPELPPEARVWLKRPNVMP